MEHKQHKTAARIACLVMVVLMGLGLFSTLIYALL